MKENRRFTIRSGLADGILDTVIPLGSDNGSFKLKSQLTVRSVVCLLGSALLFMFLAFTTPIGKAGVIQDILWMSGYWLLTWLLVRPTPTKMLGYTYAIASFKYANPEFRTLSTRPYCTAKPAVKFIGILDDGVDDDGNIYFANGDVGQVYELAGNASALMFESDKFVVLEDAHRFYRNINPLTTLTFDTLSSPQRVKPQLKGKVWQLKHMSLVQTNLDRLLKLEARVLRDYVGKEFTTLHQYLIVRSINGTELKLFIDWLDSTLHSNSLYLKDARKLDSKKECLAYLRTIYTSRTRSLIRKDL